MGTLNKKQIPHLVSRVDKLTATAGPALKDEIDAILELGWELIIIKDIGANTFAFYTRPKGQK